MQDDIETRVGLEIFLGVISVVLPDEITLGVRCTCGECDENGFIKFLADIVALIDDGGLGIGRRDFISSAEMGSKASHDGKDSRRTKHHCC